MKNFSSSFYCLYTCGKEKYILCKSTVEFDERWMRYVDRIPQHTT